MVQRCGSSGPHPSTFPQITASGHPSPSPSDFFLDAPTDVYKSVRTHFHREPGTAAVSPSTPQICPPTTRTGWIRPPSLRRLPGDAPEPRGRDEDSFTSPSAAPRDDY